MTIQKRIEDLERKTVDALCKGKPRIVIQGARCGNEKLNSEEPELLREIVK